MDPKKNYTITICTEVICQAYRKKSNTQNRRAIFVILNGKRDSGDRCVFRRKYYVCTLGV